MDACCECVFAPFSLILFDIKWVDESRAVLCSKYYRSSQFWTGNKDEIQQTKSLIPIYLASPTDASTKPRETYPSILFRIPRVKLGPPISMSDKFGEMTNDKFTFIVDDFLLTTTLKTVLVSELYSAFCETIVELIKLNVQVGRKGACGNTLCVAFLNGFFHMKKLFMMEFII